MTETLINPHIYIHGYKENDVQVYENIGAHWYMCTKKSNNQQITAVILKSYIFILLSRVDTKIFMLRAYDCSFVVTSIATWQGAHGLPRQPRTLPSHARDSPSPPI